MNEKLLEIKLIRVVKELGGKPLKFHSPYEIGYPDRIILMPGGKTYFAEIKTTGKKPTKMQAVRHTSLINLGFKVYIIDSEESLSNFINDIQNGK